MTIGSQLVSVVQEATLMEQAIIVSLLLGFSGFSVHAQVASILAQTDIDLNLFSSLESFKDFLLLFILFCFGILYMKNLIWS